MLIDILVYSLRYCALLNVKAAQYTTSDRKKKVCLISVLSSEL
ncbi:hypothetical protein [Klebsiella pneumoniae IS46]|nr:hypothetical protein [Klebsiella pneumoniae IS46]